MKISDERIALFSAMSELQGELENPCRTADNPFFKSKYTPLDVMIDHVSPLLKKHGLSVMQFPCSGESAIGVVTVITHKSGQYIESDPFYLNLVKFTPQDGGSAITYARRYSLAACLNIASDTDDDAEKVRKRKLGGKIDKAGDPVLCERCEKEIVDAYDKSGELWEAESIIKYSMQRYKGKKLCPECQKEIHKQALADEDKALKKGKVNGDQGA